MNCCCSSCGEHLQLCGCLLLLLWPFHHGSANPSAFISLPAGCITLLCVCAAGIELARCTMLGLGPRCSTACAARSGSAVMVVVVVLDTLPTLHPVAACAGRQCHCQAGQWPNSSLKQVEGVVCVCVIKRVTMCQRAHAAASASCRTYTVKVSSIVRWCWYTSCTNAVPDQQAPDQTKYLDSINSSNRQHTWPQPYQSHRHVYKRIS